MEQNANALPKVTLGQYKGLEFTRRVRPVSEKAVELEAANLKAHRLYGNQFPKLIHIISVLLQFQQTKIRIIGENKT